MFFRGFPKDWGYYVLCGVNEVIDWVTTLEFSMSDIHYLESTNKFELEFLEYLHKFKFNGNIRAFREGSIVGAEHPVLTVGGSLGECQFVETGILNIINFQTLVATKANRIREIAKKSILMEFSARRAQGQEAALKLSRAAYIGGFNSTSNVLAGKEYGIPISGTMAHSYVMSFETEIEAFVQYYKCYGKYSVFLIDTYDVIQGAKNAVKVFNGDCNCQGVRIDSWPSDIVFKEVRDILDDAGLYNTGIYVSNDMDETKIKSILSKYGDCIKGFGVGTNLAIGALSGVYKLSSSNYYDKCKFSENKMTYPGSKSVIETNDGFKVTESNLNNNDMLRIAIYQGVKIKKFDGRNLKQIKNDVSNAVKKNIKTFFCKNLFERYIMVRDQHIK